MRNSFERTRIKKRKVNNHGRHGNHGKEFQRNERVLDQGEAQCHKVKGKSLSTNV